jgi:hypothetical protein
MILLTLYPRPLVHSSGIITLMHEARGHVVIGEISIQRGPGAGYRVEEKIEETRAEHGKLNRTNDMITLEGGHTSG